MDWIITIGLETHVQLATSSKIFSEASTKFGRSPNSQASFIDFALPGVLPVINEKAVEYAIRFGFATGGKINQNSIFARKNYFYPDLPKGYQISQYESPIIEGGDIQIWSNGSEKTIRLTRAHLEEDAGKSLHDKHPTQSAIDLNRAGTPLLEIVTEPDISSSQEAVAYAKTLYELVTWIGICSGNMQEGNFRCDANVSVRKTLNDDLGTRREIKNLNSFKFLQSAIDYEAAWQMHQLENGNRINQATVLYDSVKNETRLMRTKEDAHDYRYFADPDLLPLEIDPQFTEKIKSEMCELPSQVKDRFKNQYRLTDIESLQLVASQAIASYFEKAVRAARDLGKLNGVEKIIANWILGEVFAKLKKQELNIDKCPLDPEKLARLVARIIDGTLSSNLAKKVFEDIWDSDQTVDGVISQKGLKQITNQSEIEELVSSAIANNAHLVAEYSAGKEKAFNALIGHIMKATKGKANPAQVSQVLKSKLTS